MSAAAAVPGAPRKMNAVFSREHRVIARQYLWLSLAAVTIGIMLSLLMRMHILWPTARFPLIGEIKPELYLSMLTVHGTLMVFFVMTTAPLNLFANLVLAEQLGAKEMALPTVNAVSFWLTAAALVVQVAALFVPGSASIAGWTQYPPLSAIADAGPGQGLGTDMWLASIALFCVASTLGAINFLVTVLHMRAKGMHLMRMPLTVWGWFVTSMLVLLSFSVLLAALLLLFSDRHWHTSFFVPAGVVVNGVGSAHSGGSPLLWQHLFWFFGHPEVYIAILPAMGIVSHVLANFSRKPPFGYAAMVYSTIAIGVLGFVVWGHHMFTSGMNPYASLFFAASSMVVAVPSAVKTFNWLGTLHGGRHEFTPAMLFAIGFVSLFITGGLSGPVLAQPRLDQYLHDTYFVVAHFHLIMGMAVVFAVFAGIYYWFPLMYGRMMDARLGAMHFWLTFVGAYATFLPMHLLGIAGQPRRYSQIAGAAAYLQHLGPTHKFVTYAAISLASAQLIFFFNLFHSIRRGEVAAENPWQGTSLEWHCFPSVGKPMIGRGPYEYEEFHPQWEPAEAASHG